MRKDKKTSEDRVLLAYWEGLHGLVRRYPEGERRRGYEAGLRGGSFLYRGTLCVSDEAAAMLEGT